MKIILMRVFSFGGMTLFLYTALDILERAILLAPPKLALELTCLLPLSLACALVMSLGFIVSMVPTRRGSG